MNNQEKNKGLNMLYKGDASSVLLLQLSSQPTTTNDDIETAGTHLNLSKNPRDSSSSVMNDQKPQQKLSSSILGGSTNNGNDTEIDMSRYLGR